MPLLVVALAPDETRLLTLGEWDELRACERVLFQRMDHPLRSRLTASGTVCQPLAGRRAPSAAEGEGWALVLDPVSPLLFELAGEGALVTCGPATAPDALTAAHAAPAVRRASASLATLVAVMARLRSSDGCPWDREQTHESLKIHLLEEAHEVLEAIDDGEPAALEEELGDLLLQVAFHARMAEQAGDFDLSDVAESIGTKLVHRHPHVFGRATVADADEVVRNWETMKLKDKERGGPFEGIPAGLPALLAAHKTQKRAAQLGWRPGEAEARRRARSALDSGDVDDALFWLVAVARAAGVDPESALLRATGRFRESLA
jgi:XTP/dITP diphosphohydrolase